MARLAALDKLEADSVVGTRPYLNARVETSAESVLVRCFGRRITFPREAASAVEFALGCDRFAVKDLPGRLDDAGKLTLVRCLIREGLLVTSTPTASAFPLSHAFHSVRNAAVRLRRSFHIENPILLSLDVVIVHKKFLQLLHKLLAQLLDMVDMSIAVIGFLDGDDPIVAFTLFPLTLLPFYDSDSAAFQQTAGKGRFIHQDEDVGRIAVFGLRRTE